MRHLLSTILFDLKSAVIFFPRSHRFTAFLFNRWLTLKIIISGARRKSISDRKMSFSIEDMRSKGTKRHLTPILQPQRQIPPVHRTMQSPHNSFSHHRNPVSQSMSEHRDRCAAVVGYASLIFSQRKLEHLLSW